MAKFKIIINDINNVRDLLQEAYRLSDEQIIQAQNEINKLANSTKLQDEIMDAKGKYAKAINDYMSMKDKAISKKIEIAKILAEIVKYNGNVQDALNDSSVAKNMSFDFSKIREIVNQDNKDNNREVIELKNN
jgi:hypothetical protein